MYIFLKKCFPSFTFQKNEHFLRKKYIFVFDNLVVIMRFIKLITLFSFLAVGILVLVIYGFVLKLVL
jgi:hypothetical protein